jgi:hypothetical protein
MHDGRTSPQIEADWSRRRDIGVNLQSFAERRCPRADEVSNDLRYGRPTTGRSMTVRPLRPDQLVVPLRSYLRAARTTDHRSRGSILLNAAMNC